MALYSKVLPGETVEGGRYPGRRFEKTLPGAIVPVAPSNGRPPPEGEYFTSPPPPLNWWEQPTPPEGYFLPGTTQLAARVPAPPPPPGPSQPPFFGFLGGLIWTIASFLLRFGTRIAAWIAKRGFTGTSKAALTFLKKNAVTIVATGGFVAGVSYLMDEMDVSEEEAQEMLFAMMQLKDKRRRRFTIGYNPRVRTLQRVARHTMKLLKRHDKYIREFFPKKSVRGQVAARERAHHAIISKAVD